MSPNNRSIFSCSFSLDILIFLIFLIASCKLSLLISALISLKSSLKLAALLDEIKYYN